MSVKPEERRWTFLSGVLPAHISGRIAVRQLVELQKHVPSLYTLLCVNACALAATHYFLAPMWLTIGAPGVFLVLCGTRTIHWWRLRPQDATAIQAVRQLRLTTFLTTVLAAAFVAWSMMLDAYGGPFERGHVAIFVAITVVACIFCLTHLPAAAFAVTIIVMGVFLLHCLQTGNEVFVAVALNMAFVTVVMVRILANNFLAFVQLYDSQARADRLSEENARLAHTDSLTGLPNRRFFFQRLDALIQALGRDGDQFALAILDLDRFKPINDTYGHTAGDRVLAATGERLAGFASEDVTVARLGGDEFGILIRLPEGAADPVGLCDRISGELQLPLRVGEAQVAVGCSGGLALYPSAGRDAESLFDRADYALYYSKQRRRGAMTLFSRELEDTFGGERLLEAALANADLAVEMEVHYQPILDTATDKIALIEGLARWTSPTLGRVPPDRFIAAAERCGMIHSLTLLLLRKALSAAAQLPPDIGLSFNLSSHDLISSETVMGILATVRASGFDPKRLTLELTETALIQDFEQAQTSIAALRRLGIAIALDDFGTGFSSLSYVHRLPFDKIKIDRSFMAGINSDRGTGIVITIINLCRHLQLDCIAEGVETREQLAAMKGFGCRYVQGYLIGAPVPIETILRQMQASSFETLCA